MRDYNTQPAPGHSISGQGYGIPSAPSPPSQAPIPDACDHLDKCLSGLSESLHALEQRLTAVLAPETPANGKSAEGSNVAQLAPAPLAASINSAAYSVAALQSRVDYLLSRLHL